MQGDLHIVMEHCPDGDLFNYIANSKDKENIQANIVHVVRQIVDACSAMNQKGIIHRDIKPQNILLSGRIVKISDFGCAKMHQLNNFRYINRSYNIGTPMYSAPEILNMEPYDERCDVWSLGVILYFMVYETVPFAQKSTSKLRSVIVERTNREGVILPSRPQISEQLRELLQGMLRYRQEERPTWGEIINMRLFNPKISRIEKFISYLLTINSIVGWIVQSAMQNFMTYFNPQYLCRVCHCLTYFLEGNMTLVKMILEKDRTAQRYFDKGHLMGHKFTQKTIDEAHRLGQKIERYRCQIIGKANQYVLASDIYENGKSGRYYLWRAQKKLRKLLNECRPNPSSRRILYCLAVIVAFDRYLGQQHYLQLSLQSFTQGIKNMSEEELSQKLNSQLDRMR